MKKFIMPIILATLLSCVSCKQEKETVNRYGILTMVKFSFNPPKDDRKIYIGNFKKGDLRSYNFKEIIPESELAYEYVNNYLFEYFNRGTFYIDVIKNTGLGMEYRGLFYEFTSADDIFIYWIV